MTKLFGTCALLAAMCGIAQVASGTKAPATSAAAMPSVSSAAVDDARRAAAQRLLDASRFRARQSVLLDDTILAARADLQADCLDRAAAGQRLTGCDGTGRPRTATASRAAMLDEIMVASQTVYARQFSASEMDEITRFFKTPVGQKYGQLYPQIIAEVQDRKHAIIRKYLTGSGVPVPRRQP